MDKKGGAADVLESNAIYIIILIVFIAMFAFVYTKMNGASLWQDFYAKDTAKIIDLAKAGDEITIDMQKATEVARSNKINDFNDLFSFDDSEMCVKLSQGSASCFAYFNDVLIADVKPELGVPGNVLHFKVIAKREVSLNG
jgi:hypothetical protein